MEKRKEGGSTVCSSDSLGAVFLSVSFGAPSLICYINCMQNKKERQGVNKKSDPMQLKGKKTERN